MFRRIWSIALSTFRESIRSKILYSVLFFSIIVCGAASAFGRVTIGDQALVVVNFGLFCTSLFSVAFALISGSTLLAKELAKRTIFTILARPVARYEVLMGKWLGLLATASLLVILMAGALSIYAATIFSFDVMPILEAALFMIAELVIICALVILFSALVVTPLFIGVFTLAVFLAGRSTSYILQLNQTVSPGSIQDWALSACYTILPKLETLAMSDRLVAGEDIAAMYYYLSFAYAIGYATAVLVVAAIVFNRREFN